MPCRSTTSADGRFSRNYSGRRCSSSGLLICLWRWKRPAYMLMLIWFFISLIPAMVTPFSPNFVRTIAVWPVPFVFAGLAMDEIVQFVGT